MVATLQAQTHPNLSEDTLDVQWRKMQGADGIREDLTGGAFAAVLSTTAPTLQIASAGRSVLVDGNLLVFPSNATLDPRDVGVPPTGSQVRRDLVVARYDTSVEVLRDRGTLAIKPGTAGPAATAVRATPERTPGGVWEVPMWPFTFPASGLLSGLVDWRRWSGDHQAITPGSERVGPIGCSRAEGSKLWHHVWDGEEPQWILSDTADSGWIRRSVSQYEGFVSRRLKAGRVDVQFELRSDSASSGTPVTPTYLELPDDWSPSIACFGFVIVASTRMYRVRVSTNGDVDILGLTVDRGESITGSVSFPV